MRRRLFDIVLATAGLVAAAPLLLFAAIGIKLSSRGPVLYRATRAGAHGRPFTMYKLRTMHYASGPGITAPDDPRVFWLGWLLRRTRIDELPQLFNVLRGEMSIVGPRPEDPRFVALHYSDAHLDTLLVRPGLTSPGTLFGCAREELLNGDPETNYVKQVLPSKLALDLLYVREATVRHDIHIIMRTVRLIAGNAFRSQRRSLSESTRAGAAGAAMVSPRVRATDFHRSGTALVIAFCMLAGAGCREEEWETPQVEWEEVPGEQLLIGAGDIAWCRDNMDERTAELLDQLPGTIFTTGDHAYPHGRLQDFERCYESSWGRHRDRTRPVPGNHDYEVPGARAYFTYFGDAAGKPGEGYYSYDLGEWHVIALNSAIEMGAASEQLAWLREDLAANPSRCIVAYWHHPRFSSGLEHGSSHAPMAFWEVLYEAGAEVVLNGHEHHYERFAPLTPEGKRDDDFGIRQFIVGTGGKSNHRVREPLEHSENLLEAVPGILVLRLLPGRYEWKFLAAMPTTSEDSGSGECHDPPGSAVQRTMDRLTSVESAAKPLESR